ncbi:MAG: VacJ family lipoprotein [Dokdonella sp.]
MLHTLSKATFRKGLLGICLLALGACTVSKPRTDDPWEKFNRKVYAFNVKVDNAVIRPTAVAYRKVTTPNVRRILSNFFANIRMPITIANDALQGEIKDALKGTGRFVINTTIGFLGFFDPASQMRLPPQETDFGATLAKWGVGEGPYLVLPLIGSTTARDIWRMPVDSYFFDPMSRYARNHDFKYGQQHWPNLLFLVTLRASAIDAENLVEGPMTLRLLPRCLPSAPPLPDLRRRAADRGDRPVAGHQPGRHRFPARTAAGIREEQERLRRPADALIRRRRGIRCRADLRHR